MEKQLNIRVFGKVQGVWFRQTTKEKADSLRLNGIIMNQSDGSVYISVRGNQMSLDDFLLYCKIGSPAAKVLNVVVEEVDLQEFKDFSILR